MDCKWLAAIAVVLLMLVMCGCRFTNENRLLPMPGQQLNVDGGEAGEPPMQMGPPDDPTIQSPPQPPSPGGQHEYRSPKLTAEYDLIEQVLTVSIDREQFNPRSIVITLPDWITSEEPVDVDASSGSDEYQWHLFLQESPRNSVTITVAAIGPPGEGTETAEVKVARPLYILQSSFDVIHAQLNVRVRFDQRLEFTVEFDAPSSVSFDPQVLYSEQFANQDKIISNIEFNQQAPRKELVTVVVRSTLGHVDTEEVEVMPIFDPPLSYEPDTLYAYPLEAIVDRSEPVIIVIATGEIAEDKPFQYMNGIGLVLPTSAEFVDYSFDVGAPGGEPYENDGIWQAMPMSTFLLPPNAFIVASPAGNGLERWDFNVTPIGGQDITGAQGELFNCEFVFYGVGTQLISFQQVSGVERTYYTDANTEIYFWGDITNDHPGVLNYVLSHNDPLGWTFPH